MLVLGISSAKATIGISNIGSPFGAELKFADYDSIMFSGKTEHFIYLLTDYNKVELLYASHLWGMNTKETAEKYAELGMGDIATIQYILQIGNASITRILNNNQ